MRIEFKKALAVFSFIFALIIIFVFLSYFVILPNLIKSKLVLNTLEKTVKKDFGADLKIENPILDVKFKPEVSFKIDNISLSKKDVKIFYLDEFDLKINFKNIFKKEIEIKKIKRKR